jgi:hypothetical protein
MEKLQESQTCLESLEELVQRMTRLADMLVPYTVPMVKPEYEEDINYLKINTGFVDGYEVILHLTKGFYDGGYSDPYFLTSLQVNSKYGSFLPFNVVTKIARAFLGDVNVGHIDFVKDGQKHYCWTGYEDALGKPIPNPTKVKSTKESYEGWEYDRLDPAGVNFY